MGLIGVWNRNFLGCDSLAVLPYDQRLHRFPAYLQQLEMESNGKSVDARRRAGRLRRRARSSGASPATMRSTRSSSCCTRARRSVALDFLAPVNASSRFQQQQNLALANCFAQARGVRVRPDASSRCAPTWRQRACADAARSRGSRRTRCIPATVPQPDPVPAAGRRSTLGRLIAWYEHKVFVQSVIWDINPFDQWGVELGKKLGGAAGARRRGRAGRDPAQVRACCATSVAARGTVRQLLRGPVSARERVHERSSGATRAAPACGNIPVSVGT